VEFDATIPGSATSGKGSSSSDAFQEVLYMFLRFFGA
jgi:hypothetical protein